jgi:hypothetical protein
MYLRLMPAVPSSSAEGITLLDVDLGRVLDENFRTKEKYDTFVHRFSDNGNSGPSVTFCMTVPPHSRMSSSACEPPLSFSVRAILPSFRPGLEFNVDVIAVMENTDET